MLIQLPAYDVDVRQVTPVRSFVQVKSKRSRAIKGSNMEVAATSPVTVEPVELDAPARRRSRRVFILLAAVALLGLGDLYSTLTHVNSIGMVEINPVAAYLINADSDAGLVLYKLGTIGIAVGLLMRTRHHRSAEAASWILILVMTALTFHWHNYNETVARELNGVDYRDVTYIAEIMNRPPGQ